MPILRPEAASRAVLGGMLVRTMYTGAWVSTAQHISVFCIGIVIYAYILIRPYFQALGRDPITKGYNGVGLYIADHH